MLWQDYAFTVGSFILVVSLTPTLIGKSKPALSTSLITGFVLIYFAYLFSTLHLWIASVIMGIQSFLWFVLAYQKMGEKKKLKGAKVPQRRLKGSVRTTKNG